MKSHKTKMTLREQPGKDTQVLARIWKVNDTQIMVHIYVMLLRTLHFTSLPMLEHQHSYMGRTFTPFETSQKYEIFLNKKVNSNTWTQVHVEHEFLYPIRA